ncbi:MAG TPA: ribbon-helix-helix domain-containing protein [Burkholderiales bacterium]|nr:ribbon-helix-helix domain-containing protein [Burkholderiales bacterium]
MAVLSLRLPEDLDAKLEEQARLSNRPRSELAREAIADYLARLERERFLSSLETAARNLASNPPSRRKALSVAEQFLPLENEALALGEPASRYGVGRTTRPRRKDKR